jgi:hypothetical protein
MFTINVRLERNQTVADALRDTGALELYAVRVQLYAPEFAIKVEGTVSDEVGRMSHDGWRLRDGDAVGTFLSKNKAMVCANDGLYEFWDDGNEGNDNRGETVAPLELVNGVLAGMASSGDGYMWRLVTVTEHGVLELRRGRKSMRRLGYVVKLRIHWGRFPEVVWNLGYRFINV